MTIDLAEVQAALTSNWGGRVRLASAASFQDNRLPIDVQRFIIEEATAGAPASVLLKSVPGNGVVGLSTPDSLAIRFLNRWASLEFMQGIFGDTSPLPRLYAENRQAGWVVIEELPENDPVQAALWGNDPGKAEHGLLRLMMMLGEIHVRTLAHRARYTQVRQALGSGVDDPNHMPIPLFQIWVHALAELGFRMPQAALDEIEAVGEILQNPGDCLALNHGDAIPGLLAETDGRLRVHECEGSGYRHALMEAVDLRMLFPNSALAFVRRIPESVSRSAESAYRAILAPVCPSIANDESYARALSANSAFRAISGSLWNNELSLQWCLTAEDDSRADHVRQVRLARYDAFVQTADEFDMLPHLRRYFSELASTLRERWTSAADPLPLFPAFAMGTDE